MPWQEMATLSRSLWHWVAPPAIAIICLMIMVSCSIWFLKQVLAAFVVPTRNHVQSPQADEQNPHRGHSLQGCRNTALESKILHSLPTSEFEKKTEDDELTGTKDEECAICLGEFEAGERLRHLQSCNHAFHISCIDTWFRSHSTCPTCRTAVCGPSKLQEC